MMYSRNAENGGARPSFRRPEPVLDAGKIAVGVLSSFHFREQRPAPGENSLNPKGRSANLNAE